MGAWRCALEEAGRGRSRCEIQCWYCQTWWSPRVEFQLASVAPRLALARDQRAIELRLEAAREAVLVSKRLHADWLVAHRELQALRAASGGNRRYTRRRLKKLDAAEKERKKLG